MSIDEIMMFVLFAGLAIALIVYVRKVRGGMPRPAGGGAGQVDKPDAYFRAMFPELQPHFHPENLLRYYRARRGRGAAVGNLEWKSPPGFRAAVAEIADSDGRERVRLLDASGAAMTEFFYEVQPRGAVFRIGRGKLTVTIEDNANPRVRYWHPEREFKWSLKGGWRFTTPVAESSFDANSSGTSWSNERGASTGSSPAAAALAAGGAAAMVAGAAGVFAGGGASGDWDAQPADGATAQGGGTAY